MLNAANRLAPSRLRRATGFNSPEKLEAAGADYVFAGLKNHKEVLLVIES